MLGSCVKIGLVLILQMLRRIRKGQFRARTASIGRQWEEQRRLLLRRFSRRGLSRLHLQLPRLPPRSGVQIEVSSHLSCASDANRNKKTRNCLAVKKLCRTFAPAIKRRDLARGLKGVELQGAYSSIG